MSTSSSLQFYTIICNKKRKKTFTELAASFGGVCIDTVYGRGSANCKAFADALGFKTEEHKVIISCLIPSEKARLLTEILIKEHDFQSPNTGMAFSVPLSGLSI